VNRAHWQLLAEERVKDAGLLLGGGHWAAAYYLAGYAIECGLKACVLAYVANNPEIIFREMMFSKNCWTHNIGDLVAVSGLEAIRRTDADMNLVLGINWTIVQKWNETTRYEFKSELDAKRLYEAVTHHNDGVLPWIRIRW
jgi:hypothetical protein